MRTVESCSCEKWEAGSWSWGQYGNPEEGERLPLETATRQWLVKTEKTLCAVVTFCKCLINLITNPNPVYSHLITLQYFCCRKHSAILVITVYTFHSKLYFWAPYLPSIHPQLLSDLLWIGGTKENKTKTKLISPHNKATSYTKCIYFTTRTLFWLGFGGQSWCNPYQLQNLNAVLAWPSAMRSLHFCRPPQTCIVFYRKIKQHEFITVCCCLTLLQLTRKGYGRNVTWRKATESQV
jgi:hypothetical protein